MTRGFRSQWFVAGLALLGLMIAAGHEARAGITISGGFTPVTNDPVYEYIFNVYLTPGTTIDDSFYFTIQGLSGVDTGSTTGQPRLPQKGPATYSWNPSPGDPGTGDVSWYYTGTGAWATVSYGNTPFPNNYLGQFTVETLNITEQSQIPTPTIIDYSYTVGGVTNTGTFNLQDLAVPEPASSTIVLLIGGTAAISGLVDRTKRRRSAPTP
jgi:hypothetical protein